MITCKWLLPSFQLKLEQTKIKKRNPIWFKQMLREWEIASQSENQETNATVDIQKWLCSCNHFFYSTIFLCKHLVTAVNFKPRFVSEIVLRDNYPFIILNDLKANQLQCIDSTSNFCNLIQSYSLENTFEAAILEKDKEAAITHSKIAVLMDFLKKELDQHQNDLKQLKAMQSSLKGAFQYMHDVEEYLNSKKIPQTWSSDLNKNTTFH